MNGLKKGDPREHPLHTTPSTSIFDEVCDFQMDIKYNITLYPIFKDDRQYDSWSHETHVIASVHGMEAIFDFHYSPTETSQALLWVQIKQSVYSVFCENLQISVIKC